MTALQDGERTRDRPAALDGISERIWRDKYRYEDEETIADSWRRVAATLASVEQDPEHWTGEFLDALADFRFLPAGRILAGAGTGRAVTLFNCFVMGTVPDDMSGIFEALREAALTMQQGGGIGYDFSTLRPKGAPVRGVGADASGPLSFMDVWNAMCGTIMSAGTRRGAMMATLRCDHPDIEDFISVKRDPQRLRMFNLSVLVTDDFMQAVDADGSWDLVFGGRQYRTVRARDLWDRIMRATFDAAEPGVIFIDRINSRNNLHYCETIAATNPCGEQPLPPYGACLLGSVNLARLVSRPFTPEAEIDEEDLSRLVCTAVRMLDNVVDVSGFPLPAQRAEAEGKRRIGLGVTGLADALIMCGVRYGTPAAVACAGAWLETIRNSAYRASVDLAREKGAFPMLDRDAYLAGATVRTLPDDIRAGIAAHGIRNALLTSIAPTGTISLLADNVSSGIEPVFAFSYERRVLEPDGSHRRETVTDHALGRYRALFGDDAPLPEAFVDAQTLQPADHIAMQSAAQVWIDSSISKTINCPETIEFEAFKDVYRLAWESGCKGCTTYRPNPVTGAVLSVTETREPAAGDGPGDEVMQRPETLTGRTYKLRWPESDHALYVTMNDLVRDGRRVPFEIFINSKNMEHHAWTVALTRMISAVFRRGGDVAFVAEELQQVFDPRGGAWMNRRYVPSLVAAIGEIVERHLTLISGSARPAQAPQATTTGRGSWCSACGQPECVKQEGCMVCRACGYSTCS